MGTTKDAFMDIRIQAEIEEERWNELPNELKDRFKVKRVDVEIIKGEPAKDVYRRCPTWRKLNDEMVEALKKRTEREEQIRTELR
jgi:uncharacterized protein YggU (UPF0235/DUF167 family)